MPLKIPILNVLVHWIDSSNATGFLHKHSLPAIIYENHNIDLSFSQCSIDFIQLLNYRTAAAAAALIRTMLNLFSRDGWHVTGEETQAAELFVSI